MPASSYESTFVLAYESTFVLAYESTFVLAYESTFVLAYESTFVLALNKLIKNNTKVCYYLLPLIKSFKHTTNYSKFCK
jgi:hypothetical protein